MQFELFGFFRLILQQQKILRKGIIFFEIY